MIVLTASPFRYPGGKASMASLLAEIRSANDCGSMPFAEPFAGGAGAALELLFLERAPEIVINDADRAIHAFWWTITHRVEPFLAMLRRTRVSMAEWYRQRETYRSGTSISRLRLGFAAFYLNRCNRSGIVMNGGPIGGVKQAGKWRLNARYNKPQLEQRIQRISEYRSRVSVSGDDGLACMRRLLRSDAFLFIDPPYYEKGPLLYLNALVPEYHARIAGLLRRHQERPWVLTYDDCSAIRTLYSGWANIRPFGLRYAAATRRTGREVMITPSWMRIPTSQMSKAVSW